MMVEPLQEAFFFPPPFCRMTAAGGQPVDRTTDSVRSALRRDDRRPGGGDHRQSRARARARRWPIEWSSTRKSEGFGSAAHRRRHLVAGTSPAQYQLSYSADGHGAPGDVKTYFARCVARSAQDGTKEVPSYSRPVRVSRM